MDPLRISSEEVTRFAVASHDRNPLHVDAAYARRTPFGRPVVFGVLALLEGIGRIAPRAGWVLERVTADFQGPFFAGEAYDVSIDDTPARVKVTVKDAGRSMLRATLRFAEEPTRRERGSARPRAEASAPRQVAGDDPVTLGSAFEGPYAPSEPDLEAIAVRLGLAARGVSTTAVASLMAASYAIGMELPGRQALFARLDLAFGAEAKAAIAGRVSAFDPRFQMATLDVDLVAAKGELRALVRPPPVEIDVARLVAATPAAVLTAARVVVVGGGRGLGAAIALALGRAGAGVVATYVSDEAAAQRVVEAGPRAGAATAIRAVRADATTAEGAAALVDALGDAPVDIVVFSASPAILPLTIAAPTATRARAFVDASIAMVMDPLVALGSRLAKDATLVLVSSAYALEPPPGFAHYAAAKGAVEGLIRGVACDRGVGAVIVRPPRVRTDMTNTAFGTEDALAAEDVAGRIVRAIVERRTAAARAGTTLVVESFAAETREGA